MSQAFINFDRAAATTTVLGAELAGTLAGTVSAASTTAFSNTPAANVGGYLEAEVAVTLTLAAAPSAGKSISLVILPSVDDATFPTANLVNSEIVEVFALNPGSAAQLMVGRIALYSGQQKFALINGSDQTVNSGSVVIRPIRTQVG